jgi:hypothetical protein
MLRRLKGAASKKGPRRCIGKSLSSKLEVGDGRSRDLGNGLRYLRAPLEVRGAVVARSLAVATLLAQSSTSA